MAIAITRPAMIEVGRWTDTKQANYYRAREAFIEAARELYRHNLYFDIAKTAFENDGGTLTPDITPEHATPIEAEGVDPSEWGDES